MRDEPENRRRLWSMLRVNEIHDGKLGTTDAGPDARVHRGLPGPRVHAGRANCGPQPHRGGAASATIPEFEQGAAWHRTLFPGQGDRTQPGATHAPGEPGFPAPLSRINSTSKKGALRTATSSQSSSGSSCIGIKLRFQAHFWIGKCWPRGEPGVSNTR